ncbi:hypothetical protein [Cellulomonas sp. C5510]|uniref:hypothetical protein n=1 Tax=Cellulomonas sp. C5510 TaxID=2871170 RepID=UPI001C958439|nr:hypothetical protein [Cellulomonas sp. C5510]QZN86878.1 hypothetical protein K5O09_07145 [Cellulomonas sp. C5510]
MPRKPQDHLVKTARTTSTWVVLNSELADAYEDAVADLTAARKRLSDSFPRRAAAVRASMSPAATEDELRAALAALMESDQDEVADLVQAKDTAEKAYRAAREKWTFRSLGRKAWKTLVAAHPPTEEDNEAWRAEGATGDSPYSFASLAPDLVAKALVSPARTEAEVEEMFDSAEWSDAELNQLFQTALLAQMQARPDPLARR